MTVTVTAVRAELRSDSRGVPVPNPRLSWTTRSDIAGWTQASAEVEIDGAESVVLDGAESVLVAWPFDPIAPRGRHSLRVRVTGSGGATSDWSAPLPITGDFLGEGEWTAPLVGLADPPEVSEPALVRGEFTVDRPVERATLYATAHGVYRVRVNGAVVDEEILKPGWTPYPRRLVHET
ncbi:MAG: alpha-L-rhamnosidase N-terminal domain-containing protein, partial [Actinoallomurus sp.]